MIQVERQIMHWSPASVSLRRGRCLILMVVTALLFSGFEYASWSARVLDIDEVQPSYIGRWARLGYHLVLISLLIAATATDLDCYIIPDQIAIPGVLVGIVGAATISDLQICHLWVDWYVAIPHLRGPDIPGWYDTHRFWHALAWSLSGLAMGAAVTWIARVVSSRVLGQEAMGFGDVTLMAMIGSFLGWQAVLLVFLIAPLTGLTVGVLIMLISGKTYLPYGPWLSLAALVVLFRWAWLWEQTRLMFSDWYGLGILAAAASAGFVVLLGMVRLYRAIPGRSTG
ncbi:MAG: prepilin peptidase [Planctomycetes bacterium]|nr:prepilin peptidase [Planctomycetota bacterium]